MEVKSVEAGLLLLARGQVKFYATEFLSIVVIITVVIKAI